VDASALRVTDDRGVGLADAPPPDVTAIIVSWNTRDLVRRCLESLDRHRPAGVTMETVLVDNASGDGTAEMVAAEWPEVRLIANEDNIGYTRANNQGIRVSRGRYLLLINADAFLTDGCLERMLACAEADPRAGAVGPRLVYGDGSWQRWTAGREPSLMAAAGYYLFLERLFPTVRALDGIYLARDVRRPFRPDWVSSACMLVRKAALDQVGLMDERFFVYMDDVDLCRRLREGGWNVWYCPEAEAIHLMGQSTKRQTGTVSPKALQSFNRYFAMRRGPLATLALRALQAVGFGGRAALYSAASVACPAEAHLRAQARAHWTYCKVSMERTLGT
jgi:N-acetylglucosaminyl-diphospho-decaprenol L-rhamnosyltransferase